MKPVKFEASNRTLTPPKDRPNAQPLSIWTNDIVSVSCWVPTWRERLNMLFSARIWIRLYTGGTQPVMSVTVSDEFKNPERVGS